MQDLSILFNSAVSLIDGRPESGIDQADSELECILSFALQDETYRLLCLELISRFENKLRGSQSPDHKLLNKQDIELQSIAEAYAQWDAGTSNANKKSPVGKVLPFKF